ncbi:WD repeat-containing protein 76 isoform X1 [Ranitomeya variabilis]|uniref:WD repeat-containing protein 76 isoform X1 n=2 Tax=Ranitomeya variabilis TaxID=490064 RepID=UPI0040567481
MAPHKKRRVDLDPKHGSSSTVKKACTPILSDCAMKVPVVVLYKLNLELDQQNRKRNIKEPDHRARSEQDRQEDHSLDDGPVQSKLSPSPLAFNELLGSNISNSCNQRLQKGTLEIRGCTSPMKERAKIPVVRVFRLNIQTEAQEEACTNESDSEEQQDQVSALGNSKGHDKMVPSPVEQNALLPPSTDFARNNDLQDCDQKTVCRKQLRVQLVRMNIETKNQLENQATNESDSDHEDVQPTDCSLLNVQHENQQELSTDDSDSDQFNEQDLEKLSLYERQRLKNIKQNAKFLKAVKLLEISSALCHLKKTRTNVKREKPQIDTVMRRSNRLQRIAPSLQMVDEKRRPTIQEKFSIPPSSVNMFMKTDVDHGAWITFQDTWKSISKGAFVKPSSYECRNLSSYVNDLKSLTTEKQTIARVFPGYVFCLALHPSNTCTLVAGGDIQGVIGLWDMQSGGIYQFPLHSRVCSIAFSPSNAERLLSAGREGTIRCGDVSRSVFDEIYRGEERLSSFDFLSADGSVLIVSHFDSKLSVVDCRTPPNTHDVRGFLHLDYVRTVNVHPLARDFCLVAGDGSALIYDVRKLSASSTQPVMRLFGHTKDVYSASFSPSTGNHVITYDTEQVIRIFRLKDMENTYPVKSIGFKAVASNIRFSAAWDPKQENCFGHGINISRKINIFHVTGQLLHTFSCTHLSSRPTACAFHPTRDLMVAGTGVGQVCVWEKK